MKNWIRLWIVIGGCLCASAGAYALTAAQALAVLDEDLRETVWPYLPARLRAEEA